MVTKDSMAVIHAVDDAEANTSRYVYTIQREIERELINFCLVRVTRALHIRDSLLYYKKKSIHPASNRIF